MINASTTGRLGQDAKELSTSGGNFVVKFSLAVKQRKGETEWVNCVIWGERGKKLLPYLTKGTQVWVAGELSLNRYQTKTGEFKSSVDINVQTFEFAGGRQNSDEKKTQQPTEHTYPQKYPQANSDEKLTPEQKIEEIPF